MCWDLSEVGRGFVVLREEIPAKRRYRPRKKWGTRGQVEGPGTCRAQIHVKSGVRKT